MSSSSPSSPPSGKQPFLAFMRDARDLEALRAFAQSKGCAAGVAQEGDVTTATEFLKSNTPPDLLLVEVPGVDRAADQLNALADVCSPDTKVVVAGSINEYSFYCWLTEIGIFSYLLRPVTPSALEAIWAKATEPPPAPPGKAERKPAKIVGIMGTRGGVGATSLSVFLATMLAAKPEQRVALVDLDPQDGSISLLLDLEPSKGMREALEKPERIDGMFLDRAMHRTAHNVHVLSAEEPMHERITIHDQAAEVLMRELKQKFDLVLLDLPRSAHGFYRACLKACEMVLVVSDTTLQGLRDGLRISDLFRDYLKMKPPIFIANRVGMAPKHEMTAADLAKGLNAKVDYQVPFAPEVFMEIHADMAALKGKPSAAIRAVQKIAEMLVPHEEHDDGKAAAKLGFLKKGK